VQGSRLCVRCEGCCSVRGEGCFRSGVRDIVRSGVRDVARLQSRAADDGHISARKMLSRL